MRLPYATLVAIAALVCTTQAGARVAADAQAGKPTAVTAQAVNVRAGPDRAFPAVTWLLSGTSVTVVGCLESWRWCDVIAGRDRGWVYARYLSVRREAANVVIVNGGPQLGLPAVEFSVAPYWDAHYQGRPWYGRKAYWQARWQNRAPAPPWQPPAGMPAR